MTAKRNQLICFILMEQKSMSEKIKKPEIIVFAGPNGSGKTTVTKLAKVIEPYINADDINQLLHKTLNYI